MRKINVKMPLGKEERVEVHRPLYVCTPNEGQHVWVDDIDESGSGQVIESTVCAKCGLPWEFRNE